ncbi:SRPBCC domain-containing protein [Cognatishimia maritima]|uniref:Activator of Hsp90 ATPase homolog 1-like protein n=1 Tax=Cognatishimia maritima TaxID=870908 RepID=A0A1M5UYT9_9RHOB|nr:SRPBCC domain-containing protein [Cognatishimia maritima]SHH68090.1 Activator of Hsp90 ATPase homolog 1-like protein [Cognatishimia maritima]
MTDPIVKTVTVPVAPDRAFARFTTEIMRWWPVGRHSVSAGHGEAAQDVVIEPRAGGAVYEIMHTGERTEWGVVSHWAPPAGFSMTWHPGNDPSLATELSLAFQAEGDGTRVTLTHSAWAKLAERATEVRSHYSSGWDHVLGECYVEGL